MTDLANQFHTLKREEFGDLVIWSRNKGRDQIEVVKKNGTPYVRSIKGTWTTEEVGYSLYAYQFTDAFRK
jgi:hypothetical protein